MAIKKPPPYLYLRPLFATKPLDGFGIGNIDLHGPDNGQ
ncbi:hypothetical protein MTYM_00816 [Methylococcales bacterium]|nr:hypothetical protein MTYM_00816 [Methylococcales bacterium]